jgi:serine/threonine protein kinase
MPLSAGDKLGAYEILAPIGAGGMGEVYRAKDTKLGRQVAIKVLPVHLAADTSARERLRREAAAAAALDHPFICKVFEIGEERDELFLVMELIAGETLHQRLRSGSLPLPEALRISGEVAEALEKAHNNRFVHRDLKPANVMVTQGHVKVMDFGLAKLFGNAQQTGDPASSVTIAGSTLTELGTPIGTADYMSPEQVRGEPLDQRSDLFSFGILLCELLGNPHPFRRASMTETLAAILRDPPNLSGDLPQGLMVMIRRLLAKSRDERYPSMAEVRADLSRLSTSSVTAPADDRIPLIGREQEFAELKHAVEEALAGRGSLVMIGGEPGIGKTHLTGAILEEAKDGELSRRLAIATRWKARRHMCLLSRCWNTPLGRSRARRSAIRWVTTHPRWPNSCRSCGPCIPTYLRPFNYRPNSNGDSCLMRSAPLQCGLRASLPSWPFLKTCTGPMSRRCCCCSTSHRR